MIQRANVKSQFEILDKAKSKLPIKLSGGLSAASKSFLSFFKKIIPNSNFKQTEKISRKRSVIVSLGQESEKRTINQCPLRIKNLLTFFKHPRVSSQICCLLDEKNLTAN